MSCDESTSRRQHAVVVYRCSNRCEAEVKVMGVWTRCFRLGVQVHHMLTRSRGGDLLDRAGEDYHLAGLCWKCHGAAHAAGGTDSGMLIDGYVLLDGNGGAVYRGSDKYLLATYVEGSTNATE